MTDLKETMAEALFEDVFEDLMDLCLEHPLSVAEISRSSGLARETVQRIFDRRPVYIKSLYKLKRWIDSFDSLA